jgi:hypothetical protein
VGTLGKSTREVVQSTLDTQADRLATDGADTLAEGADERPGVQVMRHSDAADCESVQHGGAM